MEYKGKNGFDEEATEEDKCKRFKRLATSRTQRVLDTLRILGNCSNTSNYEYKVEEINKIFDTIGQTTEEIKKNFMSNFKEKEVFEL